MTLGANKSIKCDVFIYLESENEVRITDGITAAVTVITQTFKSWLRTRETLPFFSVTTILAPRPVQIITTLSNADISSDFGPENSQIGREAVDSGSIFASRPKIGQ